jgi:hypothetical protein
MSTQNVYRNVGASFAFGAAAAAWGTSTVYAVGILVTNGGSTYICLIAHTSNTFAADLAAGDWLLVTAAVWTPQNEGTGKGRISAALDRGAGNLPVRYKWRASARWVATPAANDRFTLYLLSSLSPTGVLAATSAGIALGDAELTTEAELVANCFSFGNVIATATDKLFLNDGIVNLYDRYIGIAAWNGSATKALTNTASDFWCLLTAMPDDIEAAA